MKDRITSKNNPTVKALCKLKDEPSPERFLIEGKHLVDMAFEAHCLLEVYSVEEVDYPDVEITLVSEDVLRKIAVSPSPSGIIGVAKRPQNEAASGPSLLLDRVQDPGNVGTILRSALAFGYANVFLTEGCASPYSSKAIASSQGAIFGLHIEEIEGENAAESLQKRGYFILSSALRNAIPLKEFTLPKKPLCLALGNEGRGIRESILASSDKVVRIEMEGIESLNVGVAAGILMYTLNRL